MVVPGERDPEKEAPKDQDKVPGGTVGRLWGHSRVEPAITPSPSGLERSA